MRVQAILDIECFLYSTAVITAKSRNLWQKPIKARNPGHLIGSGMTNFLLVSQ